MRDKTYAKLWTSYNAYFDPLSDDEVGRLTRAMISYKLTGEEPEFDGNERFVWPAIKRDIDESEESHQEYLENQKRNGSKGGRPKKPEPFSENPKNPRVFSETQKTQAFFQKPKKGMDNGQRTTDNGLRTTDNGQEKDTCAEPAEPPHAPEAAHPQSSEPPADAVASFLLNDGTLFYITRGQVEKWEQLFPAVDVMQQLRNMESWCVANPKLRKTRSGALRFVNNWLTKEQNKGGARSGNAQQVPSGSSGQAKRPAPKVTDPNVF